LRIEQNRELNMPFRSPVVMPSLLLNRLQSKPSCGLGPQLPIHALYFLSSVCNECDTITTITPEMMQAARNNAPPSTGMQYVQHTGAGAVIDQSGVHSVRELPECFQPIFNFRSVSAELAPEYIYKMMASQ
jgi:hypothetical protein